MPPLAAAYSSENAEAFDSWSSIILSTAAAIVLAISLQIPDDFYHAKKLGFVTLAVVALLITASGAWPNCFAHHGRAALSAVLSLGLMLQIILLACAPPRPTPDAPSTITFVPLFLCTIVFAVFTLLPLFFTGRFAAIIQRFAFVGLLGAHLAIGVWSIRVIPFTVMDVYLIQSDSADALLRGQNPYSITFPDLSAGTSTFFAPGIQRSGRLNFGYSYMPLTLLVSTAGELVCGDIRYASLACVTLAAAFVGFARRTPWAMPAMALFLMTPSGFLVIDQGWVEPCMALSLALVLWAAVRRSRLAPLLLGLFWAAKQPVLLFAPLSFLLIRKPWTIASVVKFAWRAAVVAAVVTLPLAVWNLPAFWWSAVKFQLFLQPFRDDAISYLAAIARASGVVLPSAIGFIMLAAVEWLALRRGPRTPSGCATATAAAMLVFYAFSRSAFTNYYWMIIAACLFAVSIANPPPSALPAENR